MSWAKSIVHWQDSGRVFISVPFTWYLPKAKTLCTWYKDAGYYVYAGGPAVDLMPEYIRGVADQVGGEFHPSPLKRHNPHATFTSRGCIHNCGFCAVPKIEGELRELPPDKWIPAPIVCDNNLLATSQRHFDLVIDRLKGLKAVDFNQGLDVRSLNEHHIERLQELWLPQLRFAFDHTNMEARIVDVFRMVLNAGFAKRRLNCYIMYGYHDSPTDALHRANVIKSLGIKSFVQRFQPIEGEHALVKDSWVGPEWTDQEMHRFQRYWCRQAWLSKIPYAEFTG